MSLIQHYVIRLQEVSQMTIPQVISNIGRTEEKTARRAGNLVNQSGGWSEAKVFLCERGFSFPVCHGESCRSGT